MSAYKRLVPNWKAGSSGHVLGSLAFLAHEIAFQPMGLLDGLDLALLAAAETC